MTVIFKCKSNEAYCIKILAELLSNNIKTGCFVLDDTGISLRMMDHHRSILIDLNLNANNFQMYKFNSKKIYMGINLNHFHRMLKSIKKKDSIELFINEDAPNDLGIRVIPKENNRVTTSFIKIQNVQNLDINIPTGYNKPIIVSSSEYQKLVKEMSSIGSTLKVLSKNYSIEFSCNAGGILKRTVQFGEIDEDDDVPLATTTTAGGLTPAAAVSAEYEQEFVTDQLCRITKLSGLSTNMQIFPGKPLLFSSSVGSLGKICIYIKSKEQIDSENYTVDSDCESD
jgi:proliferating cell nuclear antigen PCNA